MPTKANPDYLRQDKKFGANVRSIGQELGYVRKDQILVYTIDELKSAMSRLNLEFSHLEHNEQITELGVALLGYFSYRAKVINNYVRPRLMDIAQS
ncbi:MAG: hypothetical protein NZ750_14380 [Anaerolineae bacterium]|nr:hypothetical protein [Anaerolineae bacterium]MDW8170929.1 hypothetical protein [Anaerolineae bacterium]